MRTTASLALALALATLAACPRAPAPRRAGAPTVGDDRKRLVLPTDADAEAALARLDARAEAGDAAAAWARTHYLIDLFDAARFGRDDDALQAFAAAVGLAAERGAAATDAALERLRLETDRVLALERLHPGASAAAVLLAFDRRPPADREQALQRTGELARIAAGGGPLVANAQLRLYGFCRGAFALAATAPSPLAPRALCNCLYALYPADPAPYFDPDPARRPPLPRWDELSAEVLRLLERAAGADSRLAALATAVAQAWPGWVDERAGGLPVEPAPAALGVPAADRGQPFDHTPLLSLGDGSALAERAALIDELSAMLDGDRRDRIAVALAGRAPADAIYRVAGPAVEAGADTLELAVAVEQRLIAPPGDYWHGRIGESSAIQRLGVLPLSLVPMGARTSLAASDPRGAAWDPRRAPLGLHLVVEGKRWQLVAPGGTVATIPTSPGNPRTALRGALDRVRAAFAEEDGLTVVAGATASYAALVGAVTAARHRDDGSALFSRIALATGPPPATGRDLARRIELRAAARVEIEPTALAARAPVARQCYQRALERAPRAAGELQLELRDGVAEVSAGPRSAALRACAVEALAPAMAEAGIASARIEFRR